MLLTAAFLPTSMQGVLIKLWSGKVRFSLVFKNPGPFHLIRAFFRGALGCLILYRLSLIATRGALLETILKWELCVWLSLFSSTPFNDRRCQ